MSLSGSIELTVAHALDSAARRLADAGIEAARREARLLLAHATGREQIRLIAAPDDLLSPAEYGAFQGLITRRARYEPVSHLVGEREFWSLPFSVNPHVLDPRPDSETLVEAALALFPDAASALTILDLGTGSGCLLLSVLHERPRAHGLGVDLSGEALAVAARNAARLDLADRATFLQADWGAGLTGAFDLILCNPPYVTTGEMADLSPEVAQFDPPLALDGGRDGLVAYCAILPHLGRLLAPRGVALVEIGAGQALSLDRLVRENGLQVAEVRCDLAGIERCVVISDSPILTIT